MLYLQKQAKTIKEAMKQLGQFEINVHEKDKKFGKMMFLLMLVYIATYVPRFILHAVITNYNKDST